jgi:hypothetical protein
MERHEGDTGARAADEPDRGRDLADEGHDDAAGPEQVNEAGFAQGYDQIKDTPEEHQKPNFARGTSREPVPGTEHEGRFSEGQEQTPETSEKDAERRYSEGQERRPTGG